MQTKLSFLSSSKIFMKKTFMKKKIKRNDVEDKGKYIQSIYVFKLNFFRVIAIL